SMIGCMFTSLKVVNIAVSFFTATKRLETVLRNEDILVRRSTRLPATAEVEVTGDVVAAAGLLVAGTAVAFAFSASSLVILPSLPVPSTEAGSTPFSLRILAAAGDAVPAA